MRTMQTILIELKKVLRISLMGFKKLINENGSQFMKWIINGFIKLVISSEEIAPTTEILFIWKLLKD